MILWQAERTFTRQALKCVPASHGGSAWIARTTPLHRGSGPPCSLLCPQPAASSAAGTSVHSQLPCVPALSQAQAEKLESMKTDLKSELEPMKESLDSIGTKLDSLLHWRTGVMAVTSLLLLTGGAYVKFVMLA